MRDRLSRIRVWLGLEVEPPKDQALESELKRKADRLRVLRIDAGLPPDRRYKTSPTHPNRRVTDS